MTVAGAERRALTPPQQPAEQGNAPEPDEQASMFRRIGLAALWYLVVTTMIKGYKAGHKAATDGALEPSGEGSQLTRPSTRNNLWEDGCNFDISVYISAEEDPTFNEDELVWNEKSISYDLEESNTRALDLNLTTPVEMLHSNASMHAHVFFFRTGSNPRSYQKRTTDVMYVHHDMTVFRPPTKVVLKRNLISGESNEAEVQEYEALLLPGIDKGQGVSDGEAGVGGGTTPEPETDSAAAGGGGGGDTATALVSPTDLEQQQQEQQQEQAWVMMWKPQLMLHLVHDQTVYSRSRHAMPDPLREAMTLHRSGHYFPIVYVDEFWLMEEQLVGLNHTVNELPLSLHYSTMTLNRWMMQSQMERQWRQQEEQGMASAKEHDVLKKMLTDTNPVLLVVTALVSMLHMLFDILAFKNDISFWRNRKSLAGLSVRSIGVNCGFQLIILLYLLDNDTSFMILFSSCTGLLIELWKLRKAVHIELVYPSAPSTDGSSSSNSSSNNTSSSSNSNSHNNGDSGDTDNGSSSSSSSNGDDSSSSSSVGVPWLAWLPRLRFTPVTSYAASRTREYDEIATAHLLMVVQPLVVGYSVYSLLHQQHKSWYSWLIGSLTGFVYAFGFVMMTPQLFINYKLQSVAAMPWRTMVYKSLNTFIDDLFAFIIEMPTMHRLACFRDDLIFLIFLYQRYLYKVDKTRVNEFGQCEQPDEATMVRASTKGDPNAPADPAAAAAAADTSSTTPASSNDDADDDDDEVSSGCNGAATAADAAEGSSTDSVAGGGGGVTTRRRTTGANNSSSSSKYRKRKEQ